MKKYFFFFVCNALSMVILAQNTLPWRNKVAPEVLASIDKQAPVDVLVLMREQADVSGAKTIRGKLAKNRFVFQKLQETAQKTQATVIKTAKTHDADINSLFVVNAVSINRASPDLLIQLASLPEVQYISFDPWVHFALPEATETAATGMRDGIEWGVDRVQAPQVWALGYSGQGIVVGGADTGYEWAHPALLPHYRGWNTVTGQANHTYNWHDAIGELNPLNNDTLGNPGTNPCGLNATEPCDDNNHGTHTMGIMTGDDGNGNQIGIAPGASWVGCRNMERGWGKPSTYLDCFQWFLAPTDLGGLNPDPAKAPHIINNSWVCVPEEGCTDLSVTTMFQTAIINLRAAGTMVVVSNGNEGRFGCATTYYAPAYFEESFSVGSTKNDEVLSDFSSRGPVVADQSFRIKPDIAAPGQDIRSCVRNGEYRNFSGTSMAGPNVAGVAALMLSARPDLAGEVDLLEDLLQQTAEPRFDGNDCGSLGAEALPNNAFGHGRINALAAVQAILAYNPVSHTTSPTFSASVAPNPVQKDVIFTLENLSGSTTLTLHDAQGKLIFAQNWLAGTRETLLVSMEGHPSGLYFWQIADGRSRQQGKLFKL
jgi:subtilisin family serine protease